MYKNNLTNHTVQYTCRMRSMYYISFETSLVITNKYSNDSMYYETDQFHHSSNRPQLESQTCFKS